MVRKTSYVTYLAKMKLQEFQRVKPKNSSITFTTGHPNLPNLQVHAEKLIDLVHKGQTHQVYDRAWVVFNKHF